MQNASALQLFLNRLLDRSTLDPEEQGAILSLQGRPSQVRANADIVSPGQTTEHACLVVTGLIGRFGQLVDGRRQITALHLAGDMCDLHSVVFPKVGWSLQAVSTTTLLLVPHKELRRVAHAYPNIAEAFWRDCVVDASILSQWVVNVGRRNARMRMSHFLCEMGVRVEQTGLGTRDRFELPATQAQLAECLGLTPVHVNRVLRSLTRDGLISMKRDQVNILDWKALRKVGEFDGGYLETSRTLH